MSKTILKTTLLMTAILATGTAFATQTNNNNLAANRSGWYAGTSLGAGLTTAGAVVAIDSSIDGLFTDSNNTDDSTITPILGLRGGYDFNRHWGVEATFRYQRASATSSSHQVKGQTFLLNLLGVYHTPFGIDTGWGMYLKAGLSLDHSSIDDTYTNDPSSSGGETHNLLTPQFGGGIDYSFNQNIMANVGVEGNLLRYHTSHYGSNYFTALVGVSYKF